LFVCFVCHIEFSQNLNAFCHTLDIVGKPSMRRRAPQAIWFHNVSTCSEEVIEY